MKRRKIIGLILFTGTLVYLLASLLALYQNQRVVLEKGMEEALKAYAGQEELNIKELDKDFNLMLDEKVDRSVLDSQVVKYEGSFARMEKNITNVTEGMAATEYNVIQLNERINYVTELYQALGDEIINQNLFSQTLYEEIESQNRLYESLQEELEKIRTDISNLEEMILKNASKQEEDVRMLQEQIALYQQRLTDLEGNVLFFQYDEETHTLNMFGKEEGGQPDE